MFRYPEDVERIQKICNARGHNITLEEAEQAWDEYSDIMCAGWMCLEESDDEVYCNIAHRLPTKTMYQSRFDKGDCIYCGSREAELLELLKEALEITEYWIGVREFVKVFEVQQKRFGSSWSTNRNDL